MSSEHTVMPSCVVASMRVACSIAQSAVLAAREPSSARGSICDRRAEMIENSAATKKALTNSKKTTQPFPHQSLIATALKLPDVRCVAHSIDAATIHPLDAEDAAVHCDGVAGGGKLAKLAH